MAEEPMKTVPMSSSLDERIKTVLTDVEEEVAVARRMRERVWEDISRLQSEGEEVLQKMREVMAKKAEDADDEGSDSEGDEGASEGDS